MMARDARQMQPARNDNHIAVMREVREAQRINSEQIRSVADSVGRLSATVERQSVSTEHLTVKLDSFITGLAVLQKIVEGHAEDIQKINRIEEARAQREEDAAKRAAEHRFTLGNNVVFWTLGALSLLFGLINVFNFIAAHWH
jgi:hypothetical protein